MSAQQELDTLRESVQAWAQGLNQDGVAVAIDEIVDRYHLSRVTATAITADLVLMLVERLALEIHLHATP